MVSNQEMDLISEFYDGYRYFGYWSSPNQFGKQYPVNSREAVIKFLKTFNGVFNCGISISTFIDGVPYILYLPFDFDSDNLELSWGDASKLYNFLVDNNYDVAINYSGYRGFHILITLVPKPYSRTQIRAAQKFFTRILKLKYFDKQIFGDIRRLIRIPGTLHCGKFLKDSNKKWVRIGEGSYDYVIKHSEGEPLDLEDLLDEEEIKDIEFEFPKISIGDNRPKHPYPCIETFINNEEPPQIIRYSYVAYHLKDGKSPEEIIQILEKNHSPNSKYAWVDWDKEKTTYQVNHIANEDYNPLSCKTLKDLDYCLKDCPYNMDDWSIKRIKEWKNGHN